MATITAAAGGGVWTTGATWVGGVAPSAADDAVLDASSGNVTVNSGAVARSLDCTGYVGTLTHTAAVTLTLGDATAGAGNAALKLVAGMTYTLGSVTTSAISFVSTSATQQTVTTGGKVAGNITFGGAGGSWILQGSLTATSGLVAVTAGTFDSNNQNITAAGFYLGTGGTTARTVTLGSSALSLSVSSGNGLWSGDNVTGLTITPNTAIVTFTGTTGSANMTASSQGMSLVYLATCITASIYNGGSYKDVTYTNGAIKTATMAVTGNATVTGTLTVTGNSAVNRILMHSNVAGTARSMTAAVVLFTNVDFQDITAAGAAAPFTGTSLGNAGGNSNVTFDAPATQTHTATAGGNWSDATKWTSRVPLLQDDVVIDGTTTGTITADMPRLGKSIDFTGFAGTASFNSLANSLYGSLTLASGMTVSGTQTTALFGRGVYAITSNGKQFTQPVTIGVPTATYTLADTFSSALAVVIQGGTFTSGNATITCLNMVISGATTVCNMGSSIINLTSTAAVAIFNIGSGAVINPGTSQMIITNASANTRTINCTGRALATVSYTVAGSTGALVMSTSGTSIGTLNFSDASNARTITFTAATITTVTGAFNVQGTAGKLMTINSSIPGSAATLSKPSGVVSCDYLSIQDSTAAGGASWYAGVNSTNVSNNTGWFFTAYSTSTFLEFV